VRSFLSPPATVTTQSLSLIAEMVRGFSLTPLKKGPIVFLRSCSSLSRDKTLLQKKIVEHELSSLRGADENGPFFPLFFFRPLLRRGASAASSERSKETHVALSLSIFLLLSFFSFGPASCGSYAAIRGSPRPRQRVPSFEHETRSSSLSALLRGEIVHVFLGAHEWRKRLSCAAVGGPLFFSICFLAERKRSSFHGEKLNRRSLREAGRESHPFRPLSAARAVLFVREGSRPPFPFPRGRVTRSSFRLTFSYSRFPSERNGPGDRSAPPRRPLPTQMLGRSFSLGERRE